MSKCDNLSTFNIPCDNLSCVSKFESAVCCNHGTSVTQSDCSHTLKSWLSKYTFNSPYIIVCWCDLKGARSSWIGRNYGSNSLWLSSNSIILGTGCWSLADPINNQAGDSHPFLCEYITSLLELDMPIYHNCRNQQICVECSRNECLKIEVACASFIL